MIQAVKDNPYKTIFAVVTFISSIVSGVFFIDDRYAQAADVQILEQRIDEKMSDIQSQLNQKLDHIQIQQLQDEIFKYEFLEQEGKASSLDKAMKQRKIQQLQELTQ